MILVLILVILVFSTVIFLENWGKVPEIHVFKGLTSIAPGSGEYDFGIVAVNNVSSEIQFIIQNLGEQDLKIEDISLVNGDTSQFKISTKSTTFTIKPNNYTTFTITFSPTSTGKKTAIVLIKNNDPNKSMYNFTVIGTAVAAYGPKDVDALAESEKVTITWSDVPGALSYNIYWSTNSGVSKETGTKIENVSSPYIHLGLTNNITYYYVVTAVTKYGEGLESDEVSARPDTTYYVDFMNGNDSNSGLSPDEAWKTLEIVNSNKFRPGEYILFKRNNTWIGYLRPPSSGTKGFPITFGAYGDGNKPIITGKTSISGWNNSENWVLYKENIWYMVYGPYKIASRVWLSGVEYVKAKVLEDVNETYRWYFDYNTSKLYVYSPSNPASYYSNIEESMAGANTVFQIYGKAYITVRDLDVRGGRYTFEILGSDFLVIEDCNVGLDSGHIGIWISQWVGFNNTANYGVIRRCIIDSGYRLSYYYEKAQTEDGIHLRDNASYWEIYDNVILDWGHTGVGLAQFADNTTVSYNKIYSNYISAEHISYGRGFGCGGKEGGCQYNEFYYNVVRNTRAPNQIGGDHNYVYYNIIDTVMSTDVEERAYGNGQGIVLTTSMYGHPEYIANFNKIYNNVIYNCDEAGIEIEDWHENYSVRYNEVINNIIFNCGRNSRQERDNVGLVIGDYFDPNKTVTGRDNIIKNNLIYSEDAENVVFYRGEIITVEELNNMTGTYNDTIVNNIQADPKFVNVLAHDFHLKFLSPAIDAGINVGLSYDFEGTPVPQGTRVDIGAFEFH